MGKTSITQNKKKQITSILLGRVRRKKLNFVTGTKLYSPEFSVCQGAQVADKKVWGLPQASILGFLGLLTSQNGKAAHVHSSWASVSILGLLAVFAGSFIMSHSAYAYEVSIGTSTDTVSLHLTPSSVNPDVAKDYHNVVISSNCPYGHSLYVNAQDTTNLVNSSDNSSVIPTSSATMASPAELSNNTWGVNTDGTDNFSGIPTASSLTDGTLTPLASYRPGTSTSGTYTRNTAVYYGAKVTTAVAPGTYTGNVVYTAIADESCTRYTLTVEAGEGAGTPITGFRDHGGVVNLADLATSAAGFSRPGYTLKGFKIVRATSNSVPLDLTSLTTKEWTTNESPILDAELSTADSIVIQATWQPITYNVSFTCNNGTIAGAGTIANVTNVSYGGNVVLPSSGCTATNKTFLGWNKNQANAGNGLAEYALGQTIEAANFTTEAGATVPLYAVYSITDSIPTVTVNKASNVSAAGISTGTTTPGTTITLMCVPSVANYGCNWTVDAGGVSITKLTSTTASFVMPTNDVAITASLANPSISSIDTMQQMTSAVCSNSSVGENKVVVDIRDGNTYRINKLKDNKCWMVQNLRISDVKLSSDTSDLADGTTFTVPASTKQAFTESFAGVTPRMALSDNTSYGGYYNFTAATAGTGSGYNQGTTSGTYSICPKGWTLPTKDNFVSLDKAFGYSGENRSGGTAQWNASYANTDYSAGYPGLVLAGRYYSDYPTLYSGQLAYYWSSTAASTTYAYRLNFDTGSTNLYPQHQHSKFAGLSIRCVAR
ncbi:fibrobacter succinogenes major paralogous domain-containing protein [Candidatus Saccharibacteria bacterium]|nr:fibrobacter succinogenes major paralogous domain-containing protein [Candidatus Saccharibacteria bacterium]